MFGITLTLRYNSASHCITPLHIDQAMENKKERKKQRELESKDAWWCRKIYKM